MEEVTVSWHYQFLQLHAYNVLLCKPACPSIGLAHCHLCCISQVVCQATRRSSYWHSDMPCTSSCLAVAHALTF